MLGVYSIVQFFFKIDCFSDSRMFWPDIVVLFLKLMSYIQTSRKSVASTWEWHTMRQLGFQQDFQSKDTSNRPKYNGMTTHWSGSGPPREAYRFAIKGEHLKATEKPWVPCSLQRLNWKLRCWRCRKWLMPKRRPRWGFGRKPNERNRISVGSLVECLAIHLYIYICICSIYIHRIWSDYVLFH